MAEKMQEQKKLIENFRDGALPTNKLQGRDKTVFNYQEFGEPSKPQPRGTMKFDGYSTRQHLHMKNNLKGNGLVIGSIDQVQTHMAQSVDGMISQLGKLGHSKSEKYKTNNSR